MTETDNNDKLLQAFFAEQKQKVADHGFSRRVMQRIPHPCAEQWQIRFWNIFLAIVGGAVFFSLGGLEMVWNTFRETAMEMLRNNICELEWRSMAIAGVVLLVMATKKIASLA